jgi:hypothetical protein
LSGIPSSAKVIPSVITLTAAWITFMAGVALGAALALRGVCGY